MIPLEPDKYYPLFNRANGNERIFRNPDNYKFFLKKYKQHISSICDTFCYCLMPNHFHFLIRIKDEYTLKGLANFKEGITLDIFLSKQFSNLFSSYTQALNKQVNRKGSLFMRAFKRKPIEDEAYLIKLVQYIHCKPVEAGLCDKVDEWKYSSYNALVSSKPTLLNRDELLKYFDDLSNFKFLHSSLPEQ